MSFSGNVKEELSRQYSAARHCKMSELKALMTFSDAVIVPFDGKNAVLLRTENLAVARKCFTLLRKTFNIRADLSVKRWHPNHGKALYQLLIHGDLEEIWKMDVVKNCCRRAFIRGAFLSAGSVSDPEKSYHFEIVCTDEKKADMLCEMFAGFGIGAKTVLRKGNHIVYVKDGAQIVDILNVMEAHVALMNFENVRILKDVANSLNRQVNCETANLSKTIYAAVKQIEDIRFIQSRIGLESLPDNLAQMAQVRLENPDVSLKELGTLLDPPVGKSGVNHRLHKLSEIADNLRGKEE